MPRLAHISNRVLAPGESGAGGLDLVIKQSTPTAAALGFNGIVRIGWDGKLIQRPVDLSRDLTVIEADGTTYVRFPLQENIHRGYYEGKANGFLWPLAHFRPDLAHYSPENVVCYNQVNKLFAQVAAQVVKSDDEVIVHDYHLVPLGSLMVQAGTVNPSAFFLHIPAPGNPLLINGGVPDEARAFTEDLLDTLFAYNFVGLQACRDVFNLKTIMARTGLEYTSPNHYEAEVLPNGTHPFDRNTHIGPFPVSIDFKDSSTLAREWAYSPEVDEFIERMIGALKIYSAERLDYSKGIVPKIQAMGLLAQTRGYTSQDVQLLQVLALGRENIPAYREERIRIEQAADDTNRFFGGKNPLVLLHEQSIRNEVSLGLMRRTDIGLITPVRDGMNLVAFEYLCAQDPEDPGVLILSNRAGAAEILQGGCLLVDPYTPRTIAEAIGKASHMTLEERKELHQKATDRLSHYTSERWLTRMVEETRKAHRGQPMPELATAQQSHPGPAPSL
jgi:trehalose 6-phosphate synthase